VAKPGDPEIIKKSKGNTNYARGRAFEYKVRDYLYEQGAVQVIRAAGSHTKIDLTAFFPYMEGEIPYDSATMITGIAVKIPCVWFVQCKTGGAVSKAELTELMEIAHKAGAQPYLAKQGKRGEGPDLTLVTY
jgi:Holliday junction resolvase